MGETLEFASAPPGHQIHSSAWWSDRAPRRDSGSGVFFTRPVSRQAATPPSHRAGEPPSAQAPGKRAHHLATSPAPDPTAIPDTVRMRCPDAAVFRLSPPLVARPLTTPGHSQWPEPPGFADATTATSPGAVEELSPSRDPTTRPLRAADESAPSVTLPPTSLHAIVWCGDTPVLQSLDDRRERAWRRTKAWNSASSVTFATSGQARSGDRRRVARVNAFSGGCVGALASMM